MHRVFLGYRQRELQRIDRIQAQAVPEKRLFRLDFFSVRILEIERLDDQLGNLFGIAIDSQRGDLYTTASSNYSHEFYTNAAAGNVPAIVQYGNIGGGFDDIGAAGTVYQLDAVTGDPIVFAQLPQQANTFNHVDCESDNIGPDRTSGVGLGNTVYDPINDQLFVSNWEDGFIYRLDMSGNILDAYDPDVTDDGTVLAAVSTPTRPAELWRFGAGGGADEHEVVVSLNDDLLAELDLAVPERVQVGSSDGVEVEALLVRPPAAAHPEAPGPGLVYIHGGPMSAYTESFFDEFQMAAADGYTVLAGNPRGSDGYGDAWMTAITGDLGNKDWDDIRALTDHLAALDTVDADRIGIGGGSYGGFMTSWAIGHTDRYRAALVERAVTNWETMAGTSDIGTWFLDMLLDASWHDDLDRLRTLSPMHYADNITTPTLIIHSEQDWRCPIEQAEQLFAVLRRNDVDVTLARFPSENHELSRTGSPRHRVERLRLVHDFYATHLLDRSSRI